MAFHINIEEHVHYTPFSQWATCAPPRAGVAVVCYICGQQVAGEDFSDHVTACEAGMTWRAVVVDSREKCFQPFPSSKLV